MMRKLFLLIGLSLIAGAAHAQLSVGCMDQAMRSQAEQIKRDFKAQGFVSIKDMMLNMKSRESAGVPLIMDKGKLYQLVFIGSQEASAIDFELYDGAKFSLDHRHLDKPAETNLLIYSFTPEKNDTFVVSLTQNLKNKTSCGSFTVLRQDEVPQPQQKPKQAGNKPGANKK
jgi:hypothetical protein